MHDKYLQRCRSFTDAKIISRLILTRSDCTYAHRLTVGSPQIRVMLVADAGLVRSGIRALLDHISTVQVIGEIGDHGELLTALRQEKTDVLVIIDPLYTVNRLELTNAIQTDFPRLRVILVSSNPRGKYMGTVLRPPGWGYLPLTASEAELEMAIGAVAKGETYISKSGLAHLSDGELLARLTTRQRQVLKLMAEGLSTKQIALTLGVSGKTVETFRAQLMERLGIRDLPGLVRFAFRVGLVD